MNLQVIYAISSYATFDSKKRKMKDFTCFKLLVFEWYDYKSMLLKPSDSLSYFSIYRNYKSWDSSSLP